MSTQSLIVYMNNVRVCICTNISGFVIVFYFLFKNEKQIDGGFIEMEIILVSLKFLFKQKLRIYNFD